MREFSRRPQLGGSDLPPELIRYLAWAAARSLPMKALLDEWARVESHSDTEMAEPPPEGLLSGTGRNRSISMKHASLGKRKFGPDANHEELVNEGWIIDFDDPENFLEAIHMQAYYFQVRWFPRFRWYTLGTPQGQFFVIADRAVAWAADGYVDAPPNCLRHPSAYVLAPISRELVLVGRHTQDSWNLSPGMINAIIACWAHDWIRRPTSKLLKMR